MERCPPFSVLIDESALRQTIILRQALFKVCLAASKLCIPEYRSVQSSAAVDVSSVQSSLYAPGDIEERQGIAHVRGPSLSKGTQIAFQKDAVPQIHQLLMLAMPDQPATHGSRLLRYLHRIRIRIQIHNSSKFKIHFFLNFECNTGEKPFTAVDLSTALPDASLKTVMNHGTWAPKTFL